MLTVYFIKMTLDGFVIISECKDCGCSDHLFVCRPVAPRLKPRAAASCCVLWAAAMYEHSTCSPMHIALDKLQELRNGRMGYYLPLNRECMPHALVLTVFKAVRVVWHSSGALFNIVSCNAIMRSNALMYRVTLKYSSLHHPSFCETSLCVLCPLSPE